MQAYADQRHDIKKFLIFLIKIIKSQPVSLENFILKIFIVSREMSYVFWEEPRSFYTEQLIFLF